MNYAAVMLLFSLIVLFFNRYLSHWNKANIFCFDNFKEFPLSVHHIYELAVGNLAVCYWYLWSDSWKHCMCYLSLDFVSLFTYKAILEPSGLYCWSYQICQLMLLLSFYNRYSLHWNKENIFCFDDFKE